MRKIAMILGTLLLAACSWRSPNATFYTMNSDNLTALSSRKVNVAVALVKVPDLLDRPQMVVYEKNSDEVKILEFSRWAEVFPDVLQTTVVNDLMAYLPNAYVRRTYFDSADAKYSVNIEVNKMESYVGDKVVLAAWWNIVGAQGKTLQRGQQSFVVKVKGESMTDLVAAQNEAVHLLAKAIAEQLMKM